MEKTYEQRPIIDDEERFIKEKLGFSQTTINIIKAAGEIEMNKQYKRVPFDIELAKKIQAGEIEGKIKTRDGEDVRIVLWDKKDKDGYVILALIVKPGTELVVTYTCNGKLTKYYESEDDLVLEVPDNEPQFKPFDKVLVRDENDKEWETSYFSHIRNCSSKFYYVAGNLSWKQCIPYEGNEYLVGTTDKPKDE